MTEREICLDTAKKMVCGDREQDYGKPEDNFQMIANLWNDYVMGIKIKRKGRIFLNTTDVAIMMALLKIARITSGNGTGDSYIDLAGYAACGYEIHNKAIYNSVTSTEEKSDDKTS